MWLFEKGHIEFLKWQRAISGGGVLGSGGWNMVLAKELSLFPDMLPRRLEGGGPGGGLRRLFGSTDSVVQAEWSILLLHVGCIAPC
jgi:hypothetical protein